MELHKLLSYDFFEGFEGEFSGTFDAVGFHGKCGFVVEFVYSLYEFLFVCFC